MTRSVKGVLAMLLACFIWGFSPFYYSYLTHLSPEEILAHRTLWSVITFVFVIRLTGRHHETFRTLKSPKTLSLIFLAGVMIGINWYVFIFSVGGGNKKKGISTNLIKAVDYAKKQKTKVLMWQWQ